MSDDMDGVRARRGGLYVGSRVGYVACRSRPFSRALVDVVNDLN
jgi:hypothetical protein